MATENFDLDLEIILLFVAAVTLSTFLNGEVISNSLFSALVAILFFMKGLHLKPDKLLNNRHKKKELLTAGIFSYILFPLAGYAVYSTFGGSIGLTALLVSFSAAAIGPSIVWSSRARTNSETASFLSLALLVPGIILTGGFLAAFTQVPLDIFGFDAFKFALIPSVLGFRMRNVNFWFLDNIKHHTSRISLWLIFLVGMIQFQKTVAVSGTQILNKLMISFVIFSTLTFLITYTAQKAARFSGSMERKSRAVGLVSGSKSFGVILLVASQLGSEAVLYAFSYYVVRQFTVELILKGSTDESFFDPFCVISALKSQN